VAAILTVAAPLIVVAFGGIGGAVVIVFVVVCGVLGANARLKRMGAEEFWESRPKD